MTKQIHFLLFEHLDGYSFNPHRPEGLSFKDDESDVEIEILAGGEKSDFGFGHRNLELRAKTSCDATESQVSFIENLINNRTVETKNTPMKLPHSIYGREVISSKGKLAEGFSPTSDFLPLELQELCLSKGKELEKHAVRFVQLMRWIEKAHGPVKVLERVDVRFGLYWKTSHEQYHCVPWPEQRPLTGSSSGGLTWSNEDQQTIRQLWHSENVNEPQGHQLLREAKAIVAHNQRSALLICYSALEVGLKQHISKCAPDAGWFAMYAPTPPLFKLLRDFLPEIHNSKQDFKKWGSVLPELKLIAKFTEDRNRLAHRGESISVSPDNYLRITEDLLFAFDVFEGHNWAKSRVSKQFGELMGWNEAK